MRVFVLVALLGVVYGRDLCRGVPKEAVKGVMAAAKIGATFLMGDLCPSFDFESVVLSGHCKHLFKQGACYGLQAADSYDGVPTYAQLAADVPNFQALGNLACKKIPGCFGQLKDAFNGCVADDAEFVSKAIARAETLYNQNLADKVDKFANDNDGSLFGDLVGMAVDKFTSVDDIKAFFDMHITEDISEDALIIRQKALAVAQNWCDSGCTDQSAAFLQSLFNHMNGGSCSSANEFCGECADRADSWFSARGNQLPCCVDDVVQKAIKAYDYVIENYEDVIEEARAAVQGGLSESAIAEAQEIAAELQAEFDCVAEVYNGNQPECTHA